MKIASVAEIKSQFSSFLKESEGGPVVVTRNGKAIAVIVGVHDDDEVERLLMAHSPRLQAIIGKSRQEIRQGDSLPHDRFWREAPPSRRRPAQKKKRREA